MGPYGSPWVPNIKKCLFPPGQPCSSNESVETTSDVQTSCRSCRSIEAAEEKRAPYRAPRWALASGCPWRYSCTGLLSPGMLRSWLDHFRWKSRESNTADSADAEWCWRFFFLLQRKSRVSVNTNFFGAQSECEENFTSRWQVAPGMARVFPATFPQCGWPGLQLTTYINIIFIYIILYNIYIILYVYIYIWVYVKKVLDPWWTPKRARIYGWSSLAKMVS